MSSTASSDAVDATLTKLTQTADRLQKDVKQLKIAASHHATDAAHCYNNGDNNNTDVANLQQRLKTLHTLLLQDRDEVEEIRAQRDEFREENERLRQLVAKHEYRIKHLLRSIEEIEQKQQQQ